MESLQYCLPYYHIFCLKYFVNKSPIKYFISLQSNYAMAFIFMNNLNKSPIKYVISIQSKYAMAYIFMNNLQYIAKLSPSSSSSWAELALFSLNPATHPICG